MDRIDINLFNAWRRISATCRADRAEALKRAARRNRVTVRKPLRAWCLCLRASDRRITLMNAAIEPMPDAVLGPDETTETLIRDRRPHRLTIGGEAIRELMKPVHVPWPGEDWKRVAERCGVTKFIIAGWIRAGTLRVQYRAPARSVGGRGNPVPIAYTPAPIDPNAFDARPPLGIWGSSWQGLWEKVPEQFELTAERVPRYRTLRGRAVFRGWTWICPGRVGPDGEYLGCGRTCNRLFCPRPVWTVPQALGDRVDVEMPADSGLAGAWAPGFTDPDSGRRSFACQRCWGMRDISLVGPDGWNAFVSHLTGGLLYGHEVERPRDEAPERRRRRAWRQANPRPAKQRRRVRQLLLEGLSYTEIARRMGFAYSTAVSTALRVYRDDGVKTRAQWEALRRRRRAAGTA